MPTMTAHSRAGKTKKTPNPNSMRRANQAGTFTGLAGLDSPMAISYIAPAIIP